ncbi:MAG: hypothetical protein M9934_08735 [Thermomicrobiales bacterium]|nr:hypothetical protein [Thermomicrobiales bacterium]
MSSVHDALRDIATFSQLTMPDTRLRPYQIDAARTLARHLHTRSGEQLAMVFSRQSGKDEVLAQVLSWTLLRNAERGGTIVVAAPTLRPQAMISRDRLRDRLLANPLTAPFTTVRDRTISVGKARAVFVSAARTANARGLTADLGLIANEAQDIRPAVWDAIFDPMAASTNATTIFLGTVWTKHTLLARQMAYLRERDRIDGRQRLFLVPWQRVAQDVPAYGARVQSRIAQLGEQHPFVRTEYFLEELDGQQSLFPPQRLAMLRGDHLRQYAAAPGKRYALLLDVAGEEEQGGDHDGFSMGRRDSTALTVVEVDTRSRTDGRPLYRVVDRRAWTGLRHTDLHAHIVELAMHIWRASWIVVDATGIGAGLASFLEASLRRCPVEVVPFTFTASSKSALGWDFVGLIETGRFKEYMEDSEAITDEYYAQLAATEYSVRRGPGSSMQWGVPTAVGHDDLVLSAALVAVLDGIDLRPRIAVGTS